MISFSDTYIGLIHFIKKSDVFFCYHSVDDGKCYVGIGYLVLYLTPRKDLLLEDLDNKRFTYLPVLKVGRLYLDLVNKHTAYFSSRK